MDLGSGFDLSNLRARFERLGRRGEVVDYDTQPWRWMMVRYLLGLILVGYAYFFEGMFIGVLGPMGPLGMAATLLAPVPGVMALTAREKRRQRRQSSGGRAP